jgi:hypothetical protein
MCRNEMEYLKKILVFLMFSCKKATTLINKREVVNLSFIEKIILLYHNAICRTCNHYEKHSAIIDSTFEGSFSKQKIENKLSEQKKLYILKHIQSLATS